VNPSEMVQHNEPLWTAEDVAAFLRVSLSMVYKLRRRGMLPAVPVGVLYRFNPEAVRAFAQGQVLSLRRRG